MAFILKINDSVIDPANIKSSFLSDESLSFDGDKIISPQFELVLDNTDPSLYDLDVSGSLLYGIEWYGKPVTIYNTDINRFIWKGKLVKWDTDYGTDEIKVTSNTYIDDTKTNCVCNYSGMTAAEISYKLLTEIAGVDSEFINYKGFQDAINLQSGKTFRCVYTKDDSQDVKSVLETFCKLTQMMIYVEGEIINCWQWKPYAGAIGERLHAKNIILNSFSPSFDDTQVVNDYNILYKSGTAAQFKTTPTPLSSDIESSQSRYGVKTYSYPNDNPDDTSDYTKFNILPLDEATAQWCGDLAISRYIEQLKIAKLTAYESMDFIRIARQVDLDFKNYYREPVLVTKKSYKEDNKQIDFEFEFMNQPYLRFERDITPPAIPYLYSVFPDAWGNLIVKYTKNTESDYLGNKIYFTIGAEWESDSCNHGMSPVDQKPGAIATRDGYNYIFLSQLKKTRYAIKVSAYDTRFNESLPSNIRYASPTDKAETATMYRCKGDPYITGISIDPNNDFGGHVVDPWKTNDDIPSYGSFDHYSPAGIYQSPIQEAETVFSRMVWAALGESGSILFIYRESDDGVDFSDWSDVIDAVTVSGVELSKRFLQYQFLFNSASWDDSTKFFILGVL